MKKIGIGLAFAICLQGNLFSAESKTNEWGSVTCGAQLSVRLQESSKEIAPTNTLVVNVELRNVSDKIITSKQTVPAVLNYTYQMTAPDGTEMKSKLPDRRTLELGTVSLTQIKPGGNLTAKINLFDVYDLKQAGPYKIIVKCMISIPDGKGGKQYCEVASNELKVTVPVKK